MHIYPEIYTYMYIYVYIYIYIYKKCRERERERERERVKGRERDSEIAREREMPKYSHTNVASPLPYRERRMLSLASLWSTLGLIRLLEIPPPKQKN